MSKCSTIPVLGDPPQISANGDYLVIIDQNGQVRILAKRPWSILVHDQDLLYWADGSDASFINLPLIGESSAEMKGLLARLAGGRVMLFVNNTAEEMIPVLVNGKLTLQPRADSSVPAIGTGFVIRNPGLPTAFAGNYGLYWVNQLGEVTHIDPGTVNGQLFKWMDGAPCFHEGGSTALSGSLGVTGIDSVKASRQVGNLNQVDIITGEFVVSDGVDDKKLALFNGTLDIGGGIGPLKADAALVANRWYYLYIISDAAGAVASAVFSSSPTGPAIGAGAFASFTRWGMAGIVYWTGSKIVGFMQQGRRFSTERQIVSLEANPGVTTTWSYLTVTQQVNNDRNLVEAVPPIAKTMSGNIGGSGSGDAGNVTIAMAVASRTDAIGEQYLGSKPFDKDIPGDGHQRDVGYFQDLVILDPTNGATMLAWRASAANRYRKVSISGYTI